MDGRALLTGLSGVDRWSGRLGVRLERHPAYGLVEARLGEMDAAGLAGVFLIRPEGPGR